MSNHASTGLYEFDPYGTNPDNLIVNERQTLQTPGLDDYYFIIPFAAPYFVDSLEVVNDQTGLPYVKGVDYLPGHYFVEAMDGTGRNIAGSIRFMRRDINGIVRLKYRTLGGQWGFNATAILEELANRQYNPLVRSWGLIDVLPALFPPIPHDQSVDDLIGSDELLDGIEEIARAIDAASQGTTDSHINDRNNPHQVTKEQVDLGSVQNYPVATEAQARTGEHNASYMTPLRTAQEIETKALQPLQSHVEDQSNPHGVTASQVGLGSVQNYPIASDAEAVNVTVQNRYMTPYTTGLFFQSTGIAEQVGLLAQQLIQHVGNTNNPHQVTAAQVGTYTKDQIDSMMQTGGTIENASKFAGMTEEEWRESLPSEDTIDEVVTAFTDGFNSGTAEIASVDTAAVYPPSRQYVESMFAGVGYYALQCSTGGGDPTEWIVEVPESQGVSLVGGRVSQLASAPDAFYYLNNDGLVHNVGSGSIQAPAIYRAGSASPAIKPIDIQANENAVYLLLENDTLVKYTDNAGTTTVATDVVEYAVAVFGGDRVVWMDNGGTLYAAGDGNFETAMTPRLPAPSETGGREILLTDDALYILDLTNGKVSVIDYTVSGSTYTAEALKSPGAAFTEDIIEMSGVSTHAVFLTRDGVILTRGLNVEGELDIPPYRPEEVLDVVAGHNFTVLLRNNGTVEYFGVSDDLSMLAPYPIEVMN